MMNVLYLEAPEVLKEFKYDLSYNLTKDNIYPFPTSDDEYDEFRVSSLR